MCQPCCSCPRCRAVLGRKPASRTILLAHQPISLRLPLEGFARLDSRRAPPFALPGPGGEPANQQPEHEHQKHQQRQRHIQRERRTRAPEGIEVEAHRLPVADANGHQNGGGSDGKYNPKKATHEKCLYAGAGRLSSGEPAARHWYIQWRFGRVPSSVEFSYCELRSNTNSRSSRGSSLWIAYPSPLRNAGISIATHTDSRDWRRRRRPLSSHRLRRAWSLADGPACPDRAQPWPLWPWHHLWPQACGRSWRLFSLRVWPPLSHAG